MVRGGQRERQTRGVVFSELQRTAHMRIIRNWYWKQKQPCLHDGCKNCHGTGIGKDGSPCVHMISCPCPKCTPRF